MVKRSFLMMLTLVFMLAFTACGSDDVATDDRTLNNFIQAIEAEFDGERDTPLYQFIGASGGVMWHGITGGYSASVYEFADIAAAEEAASDWGWVNNGRFVLEANDNSLIRFFENIE